MQMLSRVIARLGMLALIAGAGLAASSGGAVAACTLPNLLTNGQTTDASQVMANFNSLLTCVNTVVAPVQIPPQGRLTLTSNTPVMTADATAQSTIYYTPYKGNQIPIAGAIYTFSQLAYSLSTAAHLSGNLYDIFAYVTSGSVALCTGPAWSSGTVRAAAINMPNGIWSNQSTLTCTLSGGGSTTTIPANNATYLGTFYATATGQTGMAFKPAGANGGTNNILGPWNAYNRVTFSAMNRDTTPTWTYNSPTWTTLNTSNGNRVSFVDGLGQSTIQANLLENYWQGSATTSSIAVVLDSTTATPNSQARMGMSGAAYFFLSGQYVEGFQPAGIGFHYIQAMQSENSGGNTTHYTGAPDEALTVSLAM